MSSLSAGPRARRRNRVNRAMEGLASLSAAAAVSVLGIVVVSVLLRGIPALNLDLFTKVQATFGQSGGGIANAFVGSAVLVGVGAAMAVPVAVLVAIYVNE